MRIFLFASLCAPLLLVACGDAPVEDSPDARAPAIDAPADLCHDGQRDGDESDVDCGGACAQRCAIEARCGESADCAPVAGELVACSRRTSCDDADCVNVCLIDHVSCYPDPCDDDHVCSASLPFDGDPGTAFCLQRHAAGELCEQRDRDLNDCVDGYTCESTDVPFEDRCQAAPPTPLVSAGAHCLNDVDCEHGLFCNNGYECEARGELDASCFAGNLPCQPGLRCTFPAGLACEIWIDCGSQMACCATATGSECRPGALDQCAPPAGSCQRPE